MQLGLVIAPMLWVFRLRASSARTLCVTGGILAGGSCSFAPTIYALIAVINGPVPKMFMTRVRL